MFHLTPVHLSIILEDAVFTTIIARVVAMAVAMMSLRRRASSRTCLARARSILAVRATLEEKVATSCAYSFSLAKSSTYSSKLAGGDDLLLLVIFSLRRTAMTSAVLRPRQMIKENFPPSRKRSREKRKESPLSPRAKLSLAGGLPSPSRQLPYDNSVQS